MTKQFSILNLTLSGKTMRLFSALILSLLMIPAFASEVRDISEFNLKQYQGKVVYLDFWASWCKPCQKSFPWMNELQSKYPNDKFTVVTINLDTKTGDMNEFLEHIPANFEVYHDPAGTLAKKFKLPGMPTSYILDANGAAVKKHVGFNKSKAPSIEQEIEALL
jgi:thiol-disulfide isomerase/thioredoxin